MKNLLIVLTLLTFCPEVFGQIPDSRPLPLPTGLKVEVRIPKASLANLTVKETSDLADMFVFRVYTATVGASTPGSLAGNCTYTESTGFDVYTPNVLSIPINGDKVYSYILTGLRANQNYGVDVLPVNNRIAAKSGYVLSKAGHARSGNCYFSKVGGTKLTITFGASAPPR